MLLYTLPYAISTTTMTILPDCLRSNQPSLRHAETALRPGTYPFSSDQGSQTGLGSTSTRLSDRPGTLSAAVSFGRQLVNLTICKLVLQGLWDRSKRLVGTGRGWLQAQGIVSWPADCMEGAGLATAQLQKPPCVEPARLTKAKVARTGRPWTALGET